MEIFFLYIVVCAFIIVMGAVLSVSLFFIGVAIVLCLISLKLFFSSTLLFDGVVITAILSTFLNKFTDIHIVWCIIISLVISATILILATKTKVGFWIVTGAMSLLVSLFVYSLVSQFTYSILWRYIAFSGSIVTTIALHIFTKEKITDKIDEILQPVINAFTSIRGFICKIKNKFFHRKA